MPYVFMILGIALILFGLYTTRSWFKAPERIEKYMEVWKKEFGFGPFFIAHAAIYILFGLGLVFLPYYALPGMHVIRVLSFISAAVYLYTHFLKRRQKLDLSIEENKRVLSTLRTMSIFYAVIGGLSYFGII